MGRIVVGTSSWADPGFVAEWYPEGLHELDELLPIVEALSRIPSRSSCANAAGSTIPSRRSPGTRSTRRCGWASTPPPTGGSARVSFNNNRGNDAPLAAARFKELSEAVAKRP